MLPLALRADPEADVREGVSALSRTSYAWSTTVRQRFRGESAEPRIDLNAPVELQGKTEPDGYTEITIMPSREFPAPVAAVFHAGDVVGHTPIGWLRRSDMRSTGADRSVEFEGKQVRLSRAFSVALRATARRTATEELFDVLADVKSFRGSESGIVLAELRDAAVEKLWGDPQAKRAPEIQGTVIFKIADGNLSECHFVLGIGFPNSRTKTVAWSMAQWSMRFSGVGATSVEPPEAAVKVLQE